MPYRCVVAMNLFKTIVVLSSTTKVVLLVVLDITGCI
nr:MAG TPA: hypothetical protein [Caudoviricetes sp.]